MNATLQRFLHALLLALPLFLSCAVSAATGELPGDSLYRLPLDLVDQDGHAFAFSARRGTPQLVTMFYTSCPYVCPLVIDTLKKTQAELTPEERAKLQVLLVSFDPERDSVERLKEVFGQRKIDAATWTLTRTDAPSVRKLAAVLGIQYRELENREINHSTALVLLDADGRAIARTEQIGAIDPAFVTALKSALAAH